MIKMSESARATGPIVCQTWCEEQDGHWIKPGDVYVPLAEDQVCHGPATYVPMSLSECALEDDGVTMDELGVRLVAAGGVLAVGIDPDRVEGLWRLTADEAESLAGILSELAKALRES